MIHTFYPGQRFGRLQVIGKGHKLPNGKKAVTGWNCLCDCGKSICVKATNLTKGQTKSCGCLHHQMARERATSHGLSGSPAYPHWANMKTRCTNQKLRAFATYGPRGIDETLRTFEGFYAELGDPPSGMSLDRIDNNKGYIVGNVRWADSITQQRNKSNNRILTHNGETRCAAEWCEIRGISWSALGSRLKAGWSIADALDTPLQGYPRPRVGRGRK